MPYPQAHSKRTERPGDFTKTLILKARVASTWAKAAMKETLALGLLLVAQASILVVVGALI